MQGCTPARLFLLDSGYGRQRNENRGAANHPGRGSVRGGTAFQAVGNHRHSLKGCATIVSVDGQTVKYDMAAIRKEIRELQAADPNFRNRRPRAASINLGGF